MNEQTNRTNKPSKQTEQTNRTNKRTNTLIIFDLNKGIHCIKIFISTITESSSLQKDRKYSIKYNIILYN
ncbi:hypothetical protein PIROE2DRAFT_10530 [Piromyces sp. E2]|nr:hypothetical protein PIROE2DRAFT_10530 [Piromyces sp. E2]|eukprot:OUM63005.1 hypothetical protein PIROE2DRAFT_10530 [Piromyces sp. E2]